MELLRATEIETVPALYNISFLDTRTEFSKLRIICSRKKITFNVQKLF